MRDRLRCLGVRVIKRDKKAPKLKMQGAVCRAMVPFTLKMAQDLCDLADPLDQAVYYGMHHLNECYKALSTTSVNGPDLLAQNAPKFALFSHEPGEVEAHALASEAQASRLARGGRRRR